MGRSCGGLSRWDWVAALTEGVSSRPSLVDILASMLVTVDQLTCKPSMALLLSAAVGCYLAGTGLPFCVPMERQELVDLNLGNPAVEGTRGFFSYEYVSAAW